VRLRPQSEEIFALPVELEQRLQLTFTGRAQGITLALRGDILPGAFVFSRLVPLVESILAFVPP
jgi:hypothetical protein